MILSEIKYIKECGPKILAKALALVASAFVTGSFISILIRPVSSQNGFVQQVANADVHQEASALSSDLKSSIAVPGNTPANLAVSPGSLLLAFSEADA